VPRGPEGRRRNREREAEVVNGGVNGRRGRERVIVTWNVQRLSMREHNRRRLRRVVEKIVMKGWEIVLLSEISADDEGVLWLGEEEERVVVVHAKKSAMVLRGEALEVWVRDGQKRWFDERVTAVVLGGLRLVAVYQLVCGDE